MLSYNKIVKINQDFADAHQVLQTFGSGEPFKKTNHDQTPSYKYPLMWMEDNPNPVQQKQWGYSFIVTFATRVEAPKEREDLLYHEYTKAKSDMAQCLADLIAYWVQDTNYPSLGIDTNITVDYFEDATPDKLTGCSATITWFENFNYDNCIIPMDSVPTPGELCADATYQNSDSSFTQSIASGGTYTAPDVTITINGTPDSIPANTSKSYTVAAVGTIAPFRPRLDQTTQVLTYDEKWHIDNGTFDYTYTTGSLIQQLDPDNVDRILFDDSSATGISQHLFRFVGASGGYYDPDDGNYYTINGVLSDRDTEFLLSGSYYIIDRLTWTGWRGTRGSSTNLTNILSGCPYTFSGFNDFYLPPTKYHYSLLRTDINLQTYLSNRPPFDIQLTLWSCTFRYDNSTTAWFMNTSGAPGLASITGSRAPNYIRIHNWGTDDSI